MSKQKNDDIVIDAMSISKDSVIITDTNIYQIELFDNVIDSIFQDVVDTNLDTTKDKFEKDIAYINGDYFYIYRGETRSSKKDLKPGIYKKKQSGSKAEYFFVDPRTDEEKKEYNVVDHVHSLHPTSIIDTANTKEEILIAIPESSKVFTPTLSPTDDILKRVAKMALIAKEVDLDRHKERFKDKNALFNLKQVFRGENRVSVLIFDRFCEALNLAYKVIIYEKDDNFAIGKRLEEPIVVSSEDTYDI